MKGINIYRHYLGILCLLGGLISSISALGQGEEEDSDTRTSQKVMLAALDNGPGGGNGEKITPYGAGAGHTLFSKLYTPLTIFDHNLKNIIPYGAESWESSADSLVWTFTLHEKLRWSDGKRVEADDVKFTVEYSTDPDWASTNALGRDVAWGNLKGFKEKIAGTSLALDSVEVIDNRRIRFTLENPDPRYFTKLYRAYILPKHALTILPRDNETSDWWLNSDKQVGSGSFHVSRYRENDFMELSANPYYFLGKPKLDKIIVPFFLGREDSITLAMAAGKLDFSYIDFDDIKTLGNKVTIWEGLSGVSRFLDLNFHNLPPAWDDIRVRQAIQYGIDRKSITKNIFKTTHIPLNGLYVSSDVSPSIMDPYEYNPEKARALLKEAGVNPGDLKMEVLSYKGDASTIAAMQAIQSYLAQLGIAFQLRAIDLSNYRSRYKSRGDWDVVYRGTSGLHWTANPQYLYAQNGAHGGDFRGFDYRPHLADKIDRLNLSGNNEDYLRAIGDINAKTNELLTQIWLWTGKAYGASLKRVKNFYWYPAPGGGPYADEAHLWEIEE